MPPGRSTPQLRFSAEIFAFRAGTRSGTTRPAATRHGISVASVAPQTTCVRPSVHAEERLADGDSHLGGLTNRHRHRLARFRRALTGLYRSSSLQKHVSLLQQLSKGADKRGSSLPRLRSVIAGSTGQTFG
jgi:hypothetical protein